MNWKTLRYSCVINSRALIWTVYFMVTSLWSIFLSDFNLLDSQKMLDSCEEGVWSNSIATVKLKVLLLCTHITYINWGYLPNVSSFSKTQSHSHLTLWKIINYYLLTTTKCLCRFCWQNGQTGNSMAVFFKTMMSVWFCEMFDYREKGKFNTTNLLCGIFLKLKK